MTDDLLTELIFSFKCHSTQCIKGSFLSFPLIEPLAKKVNTNMHAFTEKKIFTNPLTGVHVEVAIHLAMKQWGKYQPLATDTEANSCFSILRL